MGNQGLDTLTMAEVAMSNALQLWHIILVIAAFCCMVMLFANSILDDIKNDIYKDN